MQRSIFMKTVNESAEKGKFNCYSLKEGVKISSFRIKKLNGLKKVFFLFSLKKIF